MTVKTYVKTILLTGLVSLALGGLLLHLRIHPISENGSNLVPVIAGLLSVCVVPFLFAFKRLVEYGYVLNGMLVIIGIVIMTHFTLVHWPESTTAATILLKTLVPDIAILCGNFFVGKAIYELEFFGYAADRQKRGTSYRYPHLGWWAVHLAAISIVYTFGHMV